jgi:hypothetical protein
MLLKEERHLEKVSLLAALTKWILDYFLIKVKE